MLLLYLVEYYEGMLSRFDLFLIRDSIFGFLAGESPFFQQLKLDFALRQSETINFLFVTIKTLYYNCE